MKDLHSDGEHYTPTSQVSIITNNQLYLTIKRMLEAEHFNTGNLLIRKSKVRFVGFFLKSTDMMHSDV